MFWAIKDGKVPIKSWCENVEVEAMEQAVNASRHPAAFHHIALMPDCHMGYGVPIGSVVACNDAVIPNAVGVDIGCSVSAIKMDFHKHEIPVREVLDRAKKYIPVGFEHHEEPQEWEGFDEAPDIAVIGRELESARKQLGTLGGGNHFIELQHDEEDVVWLMIHSGSRNFGYKIAQEYHKKAVSLCEMWHSEIPNKDLAFLPIGTKEAREYISAMNYAMRFAHANHELMQTNFLRAMREVMGEFIHDNPIHVHHNFARMENHFGKNVWVHRKGATSAKKNEVGIIPGSMGTASYIVMGLGNEDSLMSCSHGAGRAMGRKAASRSLSEAECTKSMDGIVFDGWGVDKSGNASLGESPNAYKNIDTVMEAQSELVIPIVKLRPLGVIKAIDKGREK